MKFRTVLVYAAAIAAVSCSSKKDMAMVVIDPGHFHASLLQKNKLEGVSDTVKVYAPSGRELEVYMSTIDSYNSRETNPTSWILDVYEGEDYLAHLPESDGSSFVVLAGNNRKKSDYILQSVSKGYHVISDKPMAINADNFANLKQAYEIADGKGLVIYDLMTERYDVQNIIAKAIVSDKDIFGELEGRIEIEDIHHFFKEVSGKPQERPMWYFDVRQQGEGIADVTTHFIDLIFWECFPGKPVRLTDVKVTGADRFPTMVSLDEYSKVTGADAFPDYLACDVKDGLLYVYSNGIVEFEVNSVPVRIYVRWDYAADDGSGDRFHEVIPGTHSSLEIVQDVSTGFSRKLFLRTSRTLAENAQVMLRERWPEVVLSEAGDGRYAVEIPEKYRHPHEEHFNMVGQAFLDCISEGTLPEWEKENTLTKYFITTKAVEIASDAGE